MRKIRDLAVGDSFRLNGALYMAVGGHPGSAVCLDDGEVLSLTPEGEVEAFRLELTHILSSNVLVSAGSILPGEVVVLGTGVLLRTTRPDMFVDLSSGAWFSVSAAEPVRRSARVQFDHGPEVPEPPGSRDAVQVRSADLALLQRVFTLARRVIQADNDGDAEGSAEKLAELSAMVGIPLSRPGGQT